ncbi:MAG TPA: SDR family oxidoreductase [Verrucomicrobiae bacterium]|jgi:NAD(P)-dependent dehydrogenase (short-subunit alcohol dehydrogenase family)
MPIQKSSPKIVLITGASTGFGRGTAEILAKAGHTVFASMRDIHGKNKGHARTIEALGIKVVELDVTETDSVDSAVKQVLAHADHLDVIVNNAGLASAGISETFTAEQLRDLFEVNVFGIQRVIRAALPTLRKQRDGLVINVGSILGRITFPFFGLYGASKYAVEAMTDGYRYELAPLGIDVVLVQPSAYPTNMYGSAQQPGDGARAEGYGEVASIPGKMLGTFKGIFEGKGAPDLMDVPYAIANLVEAAKGTRPPRVVVGKPYGADEVNLLVEPIQTKIVEALGLGSLSKLA